MYIKDICGNWINHPFWRKSFLIVNAKDIEALRASQVKEVWIDTEKGRDIPSGESPAEDEYPGLQTQEEARGDVRKTETPVPVGTEFKRASEIYSRTKDSVLAMFHEVRMGEAINTEGAEKMVDEISASIKRNPHALISLVRLKTADNYTYMHSVAVSALMIALAKQLGMGEDETQRLGLAGLLHDLGKALTPTEILNKPDRPTERELAVLQKHPEDGHRLLLENDCDDEIVLEVVRNHHEKLEGTGYPQGLGGEEVSIFTRMGAICDVYDAITSNRPYKAGWDPAESLHKMAKWSKGHLDQRLLEAFVKSLGIYPIGSLVRLRPGYLAVVIEQVDNALLKPRVKIFYSTRSRRRIKPEIIDLSRGGPGNEIVSREDPAQWNLSGLEKLWMTPESSS
jgi:putative nucleotidyltransferase with HDIG domain